MTVRQNRGYAGMVIPGLYSRHSRLSGILLKKDSAPILDEARTRARMTGIWLPLFTTMRNTHV